MTSLAPSALETCDWRWLEMVGKSRESIGRSGWGCGVGGMGVLDGERIDQPTMLAGFEM